MDRMFRRGLVALCLLATLPALADNRFCGGPVAQSGEPTDLAHVVGDQTLEALADQPASLMVCSKGYLFEKCGDHETAMKIFDRCIAAGYIGAMIWKALMLEDGSLGPPDPAGATELMRRAAQSGDSPYATLGKLHYASALHQGRGVARDEAEARRWFEAAARDGNPDAQEFLRTGYHVGDRDGHARGVGVAPLPQAMPGELLDSGSAPAERAGPVSTARTPLPLARRLDAAAPAQLEPPVAKPLQAEPAHDLPPVLGHKLERMLPPESPAEPSASYLSPLLLAVFCAGLLRQALGGRMRPARPVRPSLSGV